MNIKTIMALVLAASMLVIGCVSSGQSGYATYNQPSQGGQPSGQYVGGGCGVAPAADYAATPVNDLKQQSSTL